MLMCFTKLFSIVLFVILGLPQPDFQVSEDPKETDFQPIDTVCGKYKMIDEVERKIKFENFPATNILYLKYKGSYQQHPEAFPKLTSYVEENYRTTGTCIGFYPFDPDAVELKNLQWEVGLRVIPGSPPQKHEMQSDPFIVNASANELAASISRLKTPKHPFGIKTIPAVQAVTLETIVANSAVNGLAMNAWLTINGYVQTAPTRMEFAMATTKDPMLIPVKIIIPVVKRKTGLSLLKNQN
jgi:hypothetical protein